MAGKTSPVTQLAVAKLVAEEIRPTTKVRAERESAGAFFCRDKRFRPEEAVGGTLESCWSRQR